MAQARPPVERLMTTGILTVSADSTVQDAASTMLVEGVGSLVVVDERDEPVGMFTNTDLAEFVSEGDRNADARVSQYMSNAVFTIGVGSSLREAAAKMIRHDVHHLPVVGDGDRIVGMLSTMDLTTHYSYTTGSDVE
ncbi:MULTISPECIES: cyclic nucleotide-binding/CBS domain-containing protein [Haloferax]|uniref:CBS domain-containing protein n=1 Tax=Haloferax marinum TaxID=2666143 RepID=A0A6A8GAQ4_9EURY|nr:MULTISPECIES: CBS domain-containing protein [Haloferax]KAB1198689.1 CBS domain-containing protein [Haloferax sp. CBA1150]MRW97805.1 CBS domain-containing protein [Haloferax marinum]